MPNSDEAFFDEDDEGLWLNTANLSKQDCEVASSRQPFSDKTAVVKAINSCRLARRSISSSWRCVTRFGPESSSVDVVSEASQIHGHGRAAAAG